MMNLRLLSKLKALDSVSLILRPSAGEMLDYFLISRSIAYEIICTGQTAGSIPSGMISFDIRMASIVPLIEKGYSFFIQYEGDELKFVAEGEQIAITPSYVESTDTNAFRVLEKYIRFSNALEDSARQVHQVETLQNELSCLKNRYQGLTLMQLSGGPSDNPFGPVPTQKLDDTYQPLIAEKEAQLNKALSQSAGLQQLDLSAFRDIAGAAARSHSLVDMCGDYALLSLKASFLLQKSPCPTQSIQGQLFHQLLSDGLGKGFYWFNDELVYLNGEKEKTIVFVAKYLPANDVDSTIVTRGTVTEKYKVKIKSILNITALVKSQFPKFQMDMGAAQFILSNDLGETIKMHFDIEDAKSVALAKVMRGEAIQGGVTMATIDVPSDAQSVLNLFKEDLTVYIKNKKVVFQNKGLYLVFGR